MLLFFRLATELVALDLRENGRPVVLRGVGVEACHISFSLVGELDRFGYMILDTFYGTILSYPPQLTQGDVLHCSLSPFIALFLALLHYLMQRGDLGCIIGDGVAHPTGFEMELLEV